MSKRENRDTYLPESEIVNRVLDTSDQISRFLGHLREKASEEQAQLKIEELMRLQSELTTRIADYRKKEPWQVRDTYVQYADPGNGRVDAMIEQYDGSTAQEDVNGFVLALNEELANELEPVSINQGVEEAADAFNNLQFLVREHCRKISTNRSLDADI